MSNPYAELLKLLPKQDGTIGKIISINDSRYALLASVPDGTFRASIPKDAGYSVGNWVIVKDNVITSLLGLNDTTQVIDAVNVSITVL